MGHFVLQVTHVVGPFNLALIVSTLNSGGALVLALDRSICVEGFKYLRPKVGLRAVANLLYLLIGTYGDTKDKLHYELYHARF